MVARRPSSEVSSQMLLSTAGELQLPPVPVPMLPLPELPPPPMPTPLLLLLLVPLLLVQLKCVFLVGNSSSCATGRMGQSTPGSSRRAA